MKRSLLLGALLAPVFSFAQQSIWGYPTPAQPLVNDEEPITVGVRFFSSKAAYIQGIRFYRGGADTSTCVLKLYKSSNQELLDSVTYKNNTATGWVSANFASPRLISKDTVYVAAVYSPGGNYAANQNYFTAPVTNNFLTAPASGTYGPNGLYRMSNGFPDQSFEESNYWVDVLAIDSLEYGGGGGVSYWSVNNGNIYNNNAGIVTIGTQTSPEPSDANLKLAVNGHVYAKKVKVTATGWADYVFDSTYQPAPLAELEAYLRRHKHLPHIPAESTVLREGIDLGDMQTRLLKTIEENTLYILQLEKRIQELEKTQKRRKKR